MADYFMASWNEYCKVTDEIESTLYHLAEEVQDSGRKYQISLEVTEIS